MNSDKKEMMTDCHGLVMDLDATIRAAKGLSAATREKIEQAGREALSLQPITITVKPVPPPGGTFNDYWSQGPYWWPNPETSDGLPYVRRDGEVNPEIYDSRFDIERLDGMSKAVCTLADSWLVSGNVAYAEHACRFLQTFFLDPETRMNPSLCFAQAIPGVSQGRGIGLIETEEFIPMLERVILLHADGILSEATCTGLREWFAAYLEWLLTSSHGHDERATRNNHGTWLDAQLVAFALFCGRKDIAHEILQEVPSRRIDLHIEPDGKQPEELARTRSFTYSIFNLTGLMNLAWMGRHVGVDLWNYASEDGRCLRVAVNFLRPYTDPDKVWPYPQIDENTGAENLGLGRDSRRLLHLLLRQAGIAWGKTETQAMTGADFHEKSDDALWQYPLSTIASPAK